MSIRESLLMEFDREMASTRTYFERIPDGVLDYSPHEKSYTIRALVSHLANLPQWQTAAIRQESLDFAETPSVEPVKDMAEAMSRLDANVADAREALAQADDAMLMEPWTLLNNGEEIFTMPRLGVLRSFVMNHIIHHRGQLTVSMRMNNIPLPMVYGPTADEQGN
jgi:uncharacterized damage-inducible protein DinB